MSLAAGQKEREVVVVRAGSVDVVSEEELDVAVPFVSLVLSLSLHVVSLHRIDHIQTQDSPFSRARGIITLRLRTALRT